MPTAETPTLAPTSREYTPEEVKEKFIAEVRGIVDYWRGSVRSGRSTVDDALAGVAFSVLVILDGESAGLPAFTVSPRPHEDDKAYHIENGDNYYPAKVDAPCDIAGDLHNLFYKDPEAHHAH